MATIFFGISFLRLQKKTYFLSGQTFFAASLNQTINFFSILISVVGQETAQCTNVNKINFVKCEKILDHFYFEDFPMGGGIQYCMNYTCSCCLKLP